MTRHGLAGHNTPENAAPPESRLALIDHVTIAHDDKERRALLDDMAAPAGPMVLSFLNQHSFNLGWSDPDFRHHLLESDLLLRDGVGIAVCMRLLGRDPGLNLNGTDLIPDVARRFAGRATMICGTVPPYVEKAAEAVAGLGGHVVGVMDGFRDDDAYLRAVREKHPDLVILGMGMPKQERVAALLADRCDQSMLIVNGGAVLDFLAQRFPRAPRLFRRLRLEWAYRLMLEPRRLWRRYVLGGFAFLWRILALKLTPR